MKKFYKGGVSTTQFNLYDLVKESYYPDKVDAKFVDIFHGAEWWHTRKRKAYCIRLAMHIAILMVRELMDSLIERNCVFVFPVGNIKMCIRNVSNDPMKKQYVPVIDFIRVPLNWKDNYKRMVRQGKYVLVKFGPEFYKKFRHQIEVEYKTYREKYEVNGF